MKSITVSIDDYTHRAARIRAAELGTSVPALLQGYLKDLANARSDNPSASDATELRVRNLDEVIADFESRGVGLRSTDNLTRDELYDEAINGPNAIR